MRLLQETFESNFDKSGLQTFEQVQRRVGSDGKEYAMYKRTRQNGTVHGYEIFQVKTRLKGQPLPGGMFEAEDRECYPGAGSFGKTAWDFSRIETASVAFENVIETGKPFKIAEPTASDVHTPTKNVRIDLTNVNTQFTIDELVEETGMARHNVYQQLQSLISEHTVQVVGEHKVDGQRGRAKKIYAKVGV